MPMRVVLVVLLVLFSAPARGAEEGAGIGPLQFLSPSQFAATISKDIQFLDDAPSIEKFLTALDGLGLPIGLQFTAMAIMTPGMMTGCSLLIVNVIRAAPEIPR